MRFVSVAALNRWTRNLVTRVIMVSRACLDIALEMIDQVLMSLCWDLSTTGLSADGDEAFE